MLGRRQSASAKAAARRYANRCEDCGVIAGRPHLSGCMHSKSMLEVAYDNYLSDFYTVEQFESRVDYLLSEGIADEPWPTVPAAPTEQQMLANLQDRQRELRSRASG